MRAGILARRRLEHGAGLARIRIDSEDEELGGNGAEIHHPVDERLGRLGRIVSGLRLVASRSQRRLEGLFQ